MNGFSIIICCYNSARRIDETLRYVSELTIPEGKKCEVLVINNNSGDNTRELAIAKKRTFDERNIAFCVIEEPRPGLSVARKTGVDASVYDTVIFCDDDNHLNPDYLIKAGDVLDRYPNVGIVGGHAKPKFSTENREWLKDFFAAMAIGPQAPADGYVNWVYGAGMILRKEIFSTLEKKNIQFLLSDRSGKALSSGGDAEICSLTLFLGYKIYYSSEIILYHDTPAPRLERKHYIKAKMSTIAPSVYLFILNELIVDNEAKPGRLYFKKLSATIRNIFYFTPRMVLGKHQFYSVFMAYRVWQTLIWLLTSYGQFKNFFEQILINLSLHGNYGKTSANTATN